MTNVEVELVPWELVAEFSTIDEILNLRLVSRSMAESMSMISPTHCSSLLEERLVSLQISLLSNKTWKKPCQDYVAFVARPESSPLDTVMRTLRTVQYLPMEVAVAYSGRYGRHAIPLRLNKETKTLEALSYPECQRRNCRTCRMRIPHDRSASADIYNYITIRHKSHRFDLTRFYPKCIPNLPADLRCPYCRVSDERTLVLSMLSYKSAGLDNSALTFTPYNDDDYSEAEGDIGDSSEDDQDGEDRNSPDRKRIRLVPHSEYSFAYPAIFEDAAIPQRDEPPSQNRDNCKFAISLHCTLCEEFGVLAPASPCISDLFACHHVTELMEFSGRLESTVGVILVRTTCSACDKSTLCHSCSLRQRHMPYANERDTDMSIISRFWCQYCHPSAESGVFCPSCSWRTTVCHHL